MLPSIVPADASVVEAPIPNAPQIKIAVARKATAIFTAMLLLLFMNVSDSFSVDMDTSQEDCDRYIQYHSYLCNTD